jgi:hypothetical protein
MRVNVTLFLGREALRPAAGASDEGFRRLPV